MFRRVIIISAVAMWAGSATGVYVDSGWTVVKSAKDVVAEAAEQAGGGDWTYGPKTAGLTTDRCCSNYMHRSKTHSATARMGDKSDFGYASAGEESYASVVDKRWYNCVVNWNTH